MKFSIKQMLLAMIAFALVASVLGAGARGSMVAFGLAIGLVGGLIILAVLVLLYWAGFVVSGMLSNPTDSSAVPKDAGEVST